MVETIPGMKTVISAAKTKKKEVKEERKLAKEKKKKANEFDKFLEYEAVGATSNLSGERSKEYIAFEAMQTRISSTMQKTIENITTIDDNIKQTVDEIESSSATNSPWAGIGSGSNPQTIMSSQQIKSPPKEGWMSFGDNFGSVPAVATKNTIAPHLTASPQPSPQHTPLPPNNSRRESIEKDMLGGDTAMEVDEKPSGSTQDLLGLSANSLTGASLGSDILGLSRNPVVDSAKSSAMSTPVHSRFAQDMLALGDGGPAEEDKLADEPPSTAMVDDYLDEFLGIKKKEAKPGPVTVLKEESDQMALDDDPFGFGTGIDHTSSAAQALGGDLMGGTDDMILKPIIHKPANMPDIEDPFMVSEEIKAAAAGKFSLTAKAEERISQVEENTAITGDIGDIFGGPTSASATTVAAQATLSKGAELFGLSDEPVTTSKGTDLFGLSDEPATASKGTDLFGLSDEPATISKGTDLFGLSDEPATTSKSTDLFGLSAEPIPTSKGADLLGMSDEPATTSKGTDLFGLSDEPAITSKGTDLFGLYDEPATVAASATKSKGADLFDLSAEPAAGALSPDDFDPRGDVDDDTSAVKPLDDSTADMWGGSASAVRAEGDVPFDTGDFFSAEELGLQESKPAENTAQSTNPFAAAVPSTNPFADAVEGGEQTLDLTLFGGEESTATASAEGAGASFNPFATITDEPADASGSFDPFETITGDDAFVDIPKPVAINYEKLSLEKQKPKHEKPPATAARARPKKKPFTVEIKENENSMVDVIAPALPPPPKPVIRYETSSEEEEDKDGTTSPLRTNPFNKDPPLDEKFANFEAKTEEGKSDEAIGTPPNVMSSESSVDDLDVEAHPLPPFHEPFAGDGWRVLLRHPMKKKLSTLGNRYWKPVYVRLHYEKASPIVKVYHNDTDAEHFHELHLQPAYNICDMGLQTFDQFGKCHTFKIQYVFYRERVGVKADRITPTLSDLTRVRDLKSLKDLVHRPKTTMILDHAPQASELLKFGSLHYEEFKSFLRELENAFFHMPAFRDKTLTYTKDEITAEIVDEYYTEINETGHITYHKGQVRVFILAFLTGLVKVELGLNDKRRRGKEIVGRHDIIPIKTDEWIHMEAPEFHVSVQKEEYEKNCIVALNPLDACHFEVMRFRTRPRLNKELPLIISAKLTVIDKHIEIKSDVIIPGYSSNSRRANQTPCEDIVIRFPIPESWIYLFRVEKRFRYGSIKAATRKPGKIKGLERLTMVAQGFLPPSLIEVTSGTAKYENIFQAVAWRIPRLPERNEGKRLYINVHFFIFFNLKYVVIFKC